MGFFLRLLISLPLIGLGVLLIARTYRIVRKIGYNATAEHYLGGGGTYLLVKIMGLLLIVGSTLYLFGIIKM